MCFSLHFQQQHSAWDVFLAQQILTDHLLQAKSYDDYGEYLSGEQDTGLAHGELSREKPEDK